MASSVSSERAFSSAGITISKRRNRLKGDIVEALQGLKCLIREDLLFREIPGMDEPDDENDADTSAQTDSVRGGADKVSGHVSAEGDAVDEDDSWDKLVDTLDDEHNVLDSDSDDVYVQDVS